MLHASVNIEHRTPNIEHRNQEMKKGETPVYDLEERLLDYGAAIIQLTRQLNGDFAERNIGGQLLRSGTAPVSHHGEAQAAESTADFIRKMRLAIKELCESDRWLKLIQRANMLPQTESLPHLLNETDQLLRIFITSIRTAEKRRK
jgi:four helix bundle protein